MNFYFCLQMNFKKFLFRLTHWETWHYMGKYIPIMPVWVFYCLRARSWWFFTPSNPTISFGGFEGETKSEMYKQLPPGTFPESLSISPSDSLQKIHDLLQHSDIKYPFAVKPDAGMMGLMFRRINNPEELAAYHKKMPVDYIIQELMKYPLEVSVFYYRMPGEKKGTITGFLKKEFLQVTGDGNATLLELILNYERVRFRLEEMKAKHADHLYHILPAGEIYFLSYALNLSRGGRLVSLEHEKDDQLLKVFDDISHYTKYFYYGRYDIKCASVKELKAGKNFSILEFNGCGAEPHHAYGNGNTLLQAYKIFLHHWKVLYKISRYNHRHGFPHWRFLRGWNYLRKGKVNFRLLKKLDAETQL
ncbi:MAG: hypothetical protein ABJA37_14000 [Ferruginibacter sp.]